MGRSSWRAKSCRTCIARKVKCDKNIPQCFRCQSSGSICGGYRQLNGVMARRNSPLKQRELSLAANQNKTQLFSQFMDDYLPPKSSASVTYQSPVYWVETLSPLVSSQSRLVNESISALVLIHIAKSRKDDTLSHFSRRSYGLLMQQILGLTQLSDPTDLIRTGMILALYETYNSAPDQNNAWQIHVEAACNLMWQYRIPAGALNDHDLRRLRTIEILRLCINGPHRRGPIFHLQTSSLFDLFDQLLEILFKAITLYWDLQQKKDIGDIDWTSAGEIIKMSVDIERCLLDWYHQLELENHHPLFMTQAGPSSSMPINAHDQMQTITFSNTSSIHILLFYWLGLVIVYGSMFEALETLVQSSGSQTPNELYERMEATDSLCCHFVTRISQCQADATTGKGLGTAIFAKATSLAAQKISRGWKRNEYTRIA